MVRIQRSSGRPQSRFDHPGGWMTLNARVVNEGSLRLMVRKKRCSGACWLPFKAFTGILCEGLMMAGALDE